MMRARTRILASVLVLAGTSMVLSSCSHGPVPPPKDWTKGEYYTADEQARLPESERNAFCNYLEKTLNDLKTERVTLKNRLDSLNVVADTLRNQSVAVSSKTRDVNTITRDLRLKAKAMNTYEVKTGDTLRKIAASLYADPTRWKEIYDANKAAIGKEDAPLKAGMRLTLTSKPVAPPPAKEIPKNSGQRPAKAKK